MPTMEERLKFLIRCREDEYFRNAVYGKCKEDILFWFEWFTYTFNPRLDVAHLPFNLYDFQKDTVLVMKDCIENGEPLIIEKSRDMGLSWLVVLTFQWFWLFLDGADFLCGSRKEDDVDKKGDRSTLFQKFRYNLDMLPAWMCPKLSKSEDAHLKLINPNNGNVLKGESATADFGRSQRYRAVLMDEVARHPYGDYAYASVSQSTNCTILLFTPFGKANIAYRMRSNPDVEWLDVGTEPILRVPG